jgi:hypothetical protein
MLSASLNAAPTSSLPLERITVEVIVVATVVGVI